MSYEKNNNMEGNAASPELDNQAFSEDQSRTKYKKLWNEDIADLFSFKNYPGFITKNDQIKRYLNDLKKIAPTNVKVLVQGETGTGKELVARGIHNDSKRSERVFMPLNCSSISETLFESELFGHVKGSYTGAFENTLGHIRAAHGGTLFLDEINKMPLTVQPKLLRVIQERVVTPVGSTKSYHVDVRIISACNVNLKKLVDKELFCKDLYYRIKGFSITLPPLRERPEDILALSRFFITRFTLEQGRPDIKGYSPECKEALLQHAWEGNIRELETSLGVAVALAEAPLISLANVFPDPDSYHPITGTNSESRLLGFYRGLAQSGTKRNAERLHKLCEEHLAAGEKEPPSSRQIASEFKITERHARRHRKILCSIWPVSDENNSPIFCSS